MILKITEEFLEICNQISSCWCPTPVKRLKNINKKHYLSRPTDFDTSDCVGNSVSGLQHGCPSVHRSVVEVDVPRTAFSL